jgi:hypothetical protein
MNDQAHFAAIARVENLLEGDNAADLITLRSVWRQNEVRQESNNYLYADLYGKLQKAEQEHLRLKAEQEAIFEAFSRLKKEENPHRNYDEEDIWWMLIKKS